MKHSDSIIELAKALAQVQGELKTLPKPADNPYYKSSYTPLDVIWDSVRPILSKNGISVVQFPTEIGMETIVLHASGEWISGESKWDIDLANPQKIGSAITYMRRYSMCSAIGITSADEDDDGNQASGVNDKKKTPTPDEPEKRTGALILTHIRAQVKKHGLKTTPRQLANWVIARNPDEKGVNISNEDDRNALFARNEALIKDLFNKEDSAKIAEMIETGLPF